MFLSKLTNLEIIWYHYIRHLEIVLIRKTYKNTFYNSDVSNKISFLLNVFLENKVQNKELCPCLPQKINLNTWGGFWSNCTQSKHNVLTCIFSWDTSSAAVNIWRTRERLQDTVWYAIDWGRAYYFMFFPGYGLHVSILVRGTENKAISRSLAVLTHWGRVTHICVSNLTIVGCQAIIWINAGILLIVLLGRNFRGILIKT